MQSVFISYAGADFDRVQPYVKLLKETGRSVWIDYRGASPEGAEFPERIAIALKEHDLVMVFLSRHSIRRRWVIQEVNTAFQMEKAIVCVRLDDVELPDSLRLALGTRAPIDVVRHPQAFEAWVLDDPELALDSSRRRKAIQKVGYRVVRTRILDAPVALAFNVAIGVDLYRDWLPPVKDVQVLEEDDQGRPLLVAWEVQFLVPMLFRYNLRYDYDVRDPTRTVYWDLAGRNDRIREMSGYHRFDPDPHTPDGSRTRLETGFRVHLGLRLPRLVRQNVEFLVLDYRVRKLKLRADALARGNTRLTP